MTWQRDALEVNCGRCRFVEPTVGDDDEPRADCRRYPPQYVVIDGEPVTIWPQVNGDDWCGEFVLRPGEFSVTPAERRPRPAPGM